MIIIFICADVGITLNYIATNYALDEIGYDYGANMVATGLIESLALTFMSKFQV
jgi:hypothetical protein